MRTLSKKEYVYHQSQLGTEEMKKLKDGPCNEPESTEENSYRWFQGKIYNQSNTNQ